MPNILLKNGIYKLWKNCCSIPILVQVETFYLPAKMNLKDFYSVVTWLFFFISHVSFLRKETRKIVFLLTLSDSLYDLPTSVHYSTSSPSQISSEVICFRASWGWESGWGPGGPPSPRRSLDPIDLTILLNGNEDDHRPEQIAGTAAATMFKWRNNYVKKRSSSLIHPGNVIKCYVDGKGWIYYFWAWLGAVWGTSNLITTFFIKLNNYYPRKRHNSVK